MKTTTMNESQRLFKVQQLLEEQRNLEHNIDQHQRMIQAATDQLYKRILTKEIEGSQSRLKEIQNDLKRCKKV